MAKESSNLLRFKHSGKAGDIIYSLPAIIALGGGKLYIGGEVDDKLNLYKGIKRAVPISTEMISQMIELLKRQPYLTDVCPYHNEDVDYDLDKFREQNVFKYQLGDCYLRAFRVKFLLSRPWLEKIEPIYVNDIVIGHTNRYITEGLRLNWQVLKGYEDRCVFIGFEEEYKGFKKDIGLKIDRYPVRSILEFAQIIKGSALYIGNQSLGFALAEAMKHPRILEFPMALHNTMPQSCNGHIRLTKGLLEKILSKEKGRCFNKRIDNIIARTKNFFIYHFKVKEYLTYRLLCKLRLR